LGLKTIYTYKTKLKPKLLINNPQLGNLKLLIKYILIRELIYIIINGLYWITVYEIVTHTTHPLISHNMNIASHNTNKKIFIYIVGYSLLASLSNSSIT